MCSWRFDGGDACPIPCRSSVDVCDGFRGASVPMKCWTEGPDVDGSNKWFRVEPRVYLTRNGIFRVIRPETRPLPS